MNYKLRTWKLSDIDSLVEHANNYNIAKWLTNAFPYPYDKEAGEVFLNSILNDNPTKVFAIEINGEAVGSIGIFPQSDIHEKNAEMGYWLSEKYWGNDIMPKAIAEIVDYGFRAFDIARIYARPFSTNKGSQRVLEKAGFELEARLKKALFKNGEYMDELIYVKLKDELKTKALIRTIRPSEFPLMEDFMYEAIYHPDPNNPYPKAVIYYPQVRVYWDNWATGKDDHCLLALMDDKPIGAVWIRTYQGELKGCGYIDEHTPEIAIALFEEYRNQGIGTEMMWQMIALMKEKGYRQVSLSITKGNPAIRLYELLDFKVVDENEEDYIMLLDLT